MIPNHRQTASVSLSRLGIALLAVAAAQIALIFTSSTANAAEGGLFVTDLASGSVVAYASDGTPTTFASGLISPQGIVFTQATSTMAAYFYVADAGDGGPLSGVLYRYDRTGNRTTFFTGLNNPIGLAVAGGDILVAENGADRIRSVPADGSAAIISEIVTNPLGIDAAAFDQSGFLSKFIATGDSVFRGDPGNFVPLVDIDPDDVSRSVGVDPVFGDVYVTTEAGTLSQLQPDGTGKVEFASGMTDPHGLAFVPTGNPVGVPSGIYVAETSAGIISRILTDGTRQVFVTGAGNPNFITFQTISIPDPSPTPTPTPSPSPSVSPSPSASPSPSPSPTPTPANKALNLSTRVDVETGTNVGIGGFIINGTDPKLVVIRAIGPSLANFGVTGALADPVLELHDATQAIIATNDNWMDNSDADQQSLIDASLDPTNNLESAIIKTLDPGLYTAVVSGSNGGTGVGLIELYDLDDPAAAGEMANISTRGFVGTDANVMIGGVIVGPGGGLDASVVVRAIGPSLADFGVADPLLDPVLELRNGDGDLIATNDNWETDPPPNNYSAAVTAAGLAPSDPSESAIFANLTNGLYTAVVSGKDGTTGAGLVEVYHVAAQ